LIQMPGISMASDGRLFLRRALSRASYTPDRS
jgi:hypothetical protein